MTALTDIQRALNVIRNVERDAAAETRLAALALMAGAAADIARELRGSSQRPQNRAAIKSVSKSAMPKPKPLPIPKPTAPRNASVPSDPQQPRRKPKPFTEPEL